MLISKLFWKNPPLSRESTNRKPQKPEELHAETERLLLSFYADPRNQSLIASCSSTDSRLWNAIFRHVYKQRPTDIYTVWETLDHWWYLFVSEVLHKKVPPRLTRPPRGSTDPRWDELLYDRKAMQAQRWAIKQIALQVKKTSEIHPDGDMVLS